MGFLEKTLIIADMIGLFLVTRYPYFDLFCLLMRMGSKADTVKMKVDSIFDTLRPEYLSFYLNGAIFFVCGTAMTLDMRRRTFGIVSAFHIFISAILLCFENQRWSEFMMVKVVARAVGVIGGYLFVAGGLTDSMRGYAKISHFLHTGRQVLALYLFYNAYMIWISQEEKIALVKHIPGGVVMLIVVVVIYVACGLCIYGGYEAGYFGKLAAWLITVITVIVDFDVKFWYKSESHVEYWTQILLASRNISVVGALLLLGRKRHW
ncbi:predicted protein [Nematostella vectensis]|uniref:Transmembrane protein 101 n=1 Tax=Nematostella vectensis TaxID=45351 RepID=A7RPU1_NEMVE|nr:uncharacterized protein LOC125556768 [Nematostella vectensis]EDO46567.1 predicted protein [Nematostella vectensis]|eukprot:XP_001638630.1 predicted protein [Nematostella vectensis]